MPESIKWNQFGAGWVPSDDAFNGRKNGCLQMDNLELDQNGALTLAGGTSVEGSNYPYPAHTLYSNILGGSRKDYVADTNGSIFRNGTSIGAGGSPTNAAFSTAFNYTLAASGFLRYKDNGTSVVNLGVQPNTAGIAAVDVDGQYVSPSLAAATVIDPTGNGSSLLTTGAVESLIAGGLLPSSALGSFGGVLGLQSPGTATSAVLQTIGMYSSTPIDTTSFSSIAQLMGDPGGPLPGAADYNEVNSQDVLAVTLISAGGNLSAITSVILDILLVAPDSDGDRVSDYFTQSLTLDSTQIEGFSLDAQYLLNFIRGDGITTGFQRVGIGTQGWESVYGFRITINTPNGFIGCVLNNLQFVGASHTLNGSYQFVQMNVNNTGSYVAKSVLGAVSESLTFNNQLARITPYNPVIEDSQCNEAWIFIIGGTLDQWYRIMVFNTTTGFSTPNWTALSDIDLIEDDITVNLNLITAQAGETGVNDSIFDIIGPIEGRWFYFTTNFMYPSDINDPDLVDASLAIRTTGANAEIFLWARRAAANQVWVGTSRDIYLLAGTFETLPDGSIDVFYQTLSCGFPPISYDAAASGNAVFYLAADGWRSMDASGNCTALTPTNTDRLYRGITCYGYSVDVQVVAGTVRFPCALARNKLWCSITGQSRMEVLDSVRQYWRNFSIGKGDCTAICATQDGNLLGFFSSDKKLRVLDVQTSLEIDGSGLQTVNLLSPAFDNGTPRQRKDLYTLKVRANTGGQNLACSLISDLGITYSLGNVNTSSLTEVNLDVSQFLPKSKWVQFVATGTFSALTIDDFELFFDTRPIPLSFLRIFNNNFGSASKKRLRVWPHIIDTTGNTVVFTPINDGASGSPTNINTTDKTTKLIFYNTDVFSIDYGATLYCSNGTFEYWGALDPDIVQVLPIARQFDQVGPEELFRYGRVKQVELRVLAYGTPIPYTMYFNDNQVSTGNLVLPYGEETTITVGLPMGNAGSIVRVVFGPTAFNFHRYYLRLQVAKSGRDSDLEWVTLPEPTEGQ